MPQQVNRTTAEEAEYLRTSTRTLIRWRSQGIGPAYVKAGHKVIYPDSFTQEWLESRRRNPVRGAA